MKKSINKSEIFVLVGVCILCIAIVGGTVAYYRNVLFNDLTVDTITQGLDYFINYTKGNDITSAQLVASDDYTGGQSADIVFYKKDNTYDIYGHIYLDINAIGTNLSKSSALKYTVVNNDTVISEGSLMGSTTDVPVLVKGNIPLKTTNQTYTVYIWLDNKESLDTSMEGETLSLEVRCEATMEKIKIDGFVETEYYFDYTENVQTITLSAGTYLLEVWGAQGGYALDETYRGGYGGYSSGYVTLDTTTTLYVVVGGQGGNGTSMVSTLNEGGYNGGGNTYGNNDRYAGSGGGATHIALSDGVLISLSGNIDDILIVAGGGGAGGYHSTYNSTGGDAGGYIGKTGTTTKTSNTVGQGGTQTAGGTGFISGTFGQGGNATSDSIGGGGGFYGGGAGQFVAGSGGGSGYIGNTLLTDKVMYCYNCTESTEESTKTISTENVSDEAISNYAKIGNGYAKITQVG